MAIQILSKVFGGVGGILNMAKKVLPISVGIPQSQINAKNSKYMVMVTSSNQPPITAFLQDKFSFNVSSDWTDSAAMSGLFATASDIFQAGFGKTLMNTMASRRKWRGSSPVSITMKLKFEAFGDVKREVIEPCQLLQGLALPSGGVSAGEEQFFLNPPGPNPFYLEGLANAFGQYAPFGKGDEIGITIGDFIYFNSVIISSVEVVFESRMSKDGPIGAEATIQFQTYEMLTKEKLKTSYLGIATQGI